MTGTVNLRCLCMAGLLYSQILSIQGKHCYKLLGFFVCVLPMHSIVEWGGPLRDLGGGTVAMYKKWQLLN